ncbi:MAG: DNA polymerase III subunit delta [Thermodesulfobacteriota bacterium]
MDPSDLDIKLAQGKPDPVWLLHGQDVFQRDRALSRIAGLVPEETRDFNYQVFLADETMPGEILGLARTMPFIAERRVVVVRGVDRYPAEDLALFLDYLADPNERALLVLVADKVDARTRFFRTLKEKGWEFEFTAPKGRALVSWVKQAMSRRGRPMSLEAAQELVDRIGSDLAELDGELEKVYLYALDREAVGVAEVRAAARLGLTATVFKLGDAVGDQDPGAALAALKELLQTEHHLVVFTMLVRHFRLLLKARLLKENHVPQSEAAGALGLPPYAARKYLEQAGAMDLGTIKKGLARLLETNLTLVTSQAPEHLIMNGLVLDLATLRPGRRAGLYGRV